MIIILFRWRGGAGGGSGFIAPFGGGGFGCFCPIILPFYIFQNKKCHQMV